MEGILASLDWPTYATWGAFAAFTAIGVIAQTHRHARQAFQQWRLARRLSRDPYILREEMNEHRLAIGDDLAPLALSDVLKHALVVGAISAFPIWLAEAHLELWWQIGTIALAVLGLLLAWWRWLNDPESDPAVLRLPKGDIPREAMIGFAAALGVVALLLLLAVWSF